MGVNATTTTLWEGKAPDEGGQVHLARLSPDGGRIAIASVGGDEPGIYVGDVAGKEDELTLVAAADGWTPAELGWSPKGRFIGYRTVPTAVRGDEVAWASSSPSDEAGGRRGELGRADAMGFAWLPSDKGLIISDPEGRQLQRIDAEKATRRPIADLHFHANRKLWPQVSVSPDGARIAFTARDEDEDSARVWYLQRKDKDLEIEQLTWIPGADVHVLPFWSPKGVTLALFMVHVTQQKTGLVAVRQLQGHGEILYENSAADLPITPAWSPGGATIALFRNGGQGHELTLVDVKERTAEAVAGAPPTPGPLHFLDDQRLAISSGSTVCLLTLS